MNGAKDITCRPLFEKIDWRRLAQSGKRRCSRHSNRRAQPRGRVQFRHGLPNGTASRLGGRGFEAPSDDPGPI